MTKRNFRDMTYEREVQQRQYSANQRFQMKRYKNSLDSDEDDDEEEEIKSNVMDPRHLEGEEERTIEFDGEIRITPFNMKEELEEGHFDKDGTYIFHSNQDEIKDNWLDNIDWVKVKVQNNIRKTKEESDEEEEKLDVSEIYREMLELVQPKETIQKAIKRLAGKGVSASNKWKKKNRAFSEEEQLDSEENKEKFQRLSSLADKVVQSGNMDVYQYTYERLQFLLSKNSKSAEEENEKEKGEPLDMFADEVDTSKLQNIPVSESRSQNGDEAETSEEVMWEFKWEQDENAPVYGPHPTSQMQGWVDGGYFANDVFVRRVGQSDSQFYSSRRIDFELYM